MKPGILFDALLERRQRRITRRFSLQGCGSDDSGDGDAQSRSCPIRRSRFVSPCHDGPPPGLTAIAAPSTNPVNWAENKPFRQRSGVTTGNCAQRA
jgi:hypothetical protein